MPTDSTRWRAADFGERKNPDYLVYALEQRHGYEAGTLAPTSRPRSPSWCDLLILNFPVFWFSVPAMLKGWIDRVLISGLTYGGRRFYDRGSLVGKKAMLSLILGGRPHMFDGPNSVHGPLDDMLTAARHARLHRARGAAALRRLARALHHPGRA